LSLQNWRSPYQGFLQTAAHRIASQGFYFPLESYFRILSKELFMPMAHPTGDAFQTGRHTEPKVMGLIGLHSLTSFTGGVMAGTVSALLFHPFAVVKYYCWGQDDTKLWQAFGVIWQGGRGSRVFLRGSTATIARDFLFGGMFSLIRHSDNFIRWVDRAFDGGSQLLSSVWSAVTDSPNALPSSTYDSCAPPRRSAFFFCNLVAAGLSVGAASPFNHIRNMKFCTPPEQPAASGVKIVRDLLVECRHEFRRAAPASATSGVTLLRRSLAATVHLQNRLKLGVGTLRVAVGMACGSHVYDLCTANGR